MVVTVAVVVTTSNLAYGVVAGTLTAMVLLARRVAHLVTVTSVTNADKNQVVYSVHGALFFASSNDLVGQFNYADDPADVVIDLADSHVWDASSVAALDAITTKYAHRDKSGRVVGLNTASDDMHSRLSGQLPSH